MNYRKQRKEIDKAIRNLINFAEKQPEWQHRLDELFNQMISVTADNLYVDEDELVVELQDTGYWQMVFSYVFEDFATSYWDGEENSFIDEYLKRRSWREEPVARRYLQALNDSRVRFWEVTSVKFGSYAEVRPYGSNSKPVRVMEKIATQSLQQRDCLIGRVIQLDDILLFTSALFPLPSTEAEYAQQILGEIKKEAIRMKLQLLEDGGIETIPDGIEQEIEEELISHLPGVLLLEDRAIETIPDGIEQEVGEEVISHLPGVLFGIWVICTYQSIDQTIPTSQNQDDEAVTARVAISDKTMLVLQNQDGKACQMITVRFPLIGSINAVAESLNKLPELNRNTNKSVWIWLPCTVAELQENKPVNIQGHLFLQGKALELEVNSIERAERGSQWLAEKLGELVGQPLTVHKNVADNVANSKSINNSLNLRQIKEEQALIKEYMIQHYQKTLDEPIPMLNDKTPRECADDPALHQDVIQWLEYIENHSTQSPFSDYDFSRLWKELGLEQFKP